MDNTNEIIKQICLEHILTFEDVEIIVQDLIEKSTGCTLFNKSNLLKEIKTNLEDQPDNLLELSSKLISKNLIPQIKFESMFKSNLEFTLVFNQNEIIVLYKNKKIELNSINDVKKDLLENKLNYLPVITDLYLDNIDTIIKKLINKDLTVKYYLIDFPIPYWKLFEIKSKRTNNNLTDKCLEDIISGKNYCQVQIYEELEQDDELKAVLLQIEEYENKSKLFDNNLTNAQKKELDTQYRMEVMSYLNDNDMNYFLDKLEYTDDEEKNIDINNKHSITQFIGNYIKTIQEAPNKMIKYYALYKMFDFILRCENYMTEHDHLRSVVLKKINELVTSGDLYLIESAGLTLSSEITTTMNKANEMLEKIEKNKNPNYIPQQLNNLNNLSKNKILIEEDSDGNNSYDSYE